MLAMADKHGIVIASVPGLADLARVTLDKTVLALDKLSSPDKWSATTEYEGRRIEKIDRGWRLLNYVKFRNMRDEEERREYMKELMRERRRKEKEKDRQAEERLSVSRVVSNVSDVSKCYPTQRQMQRHTQTERAVKGFEVENTHKAYKPSEFSEPQNSDVELQVLEIASIYPKILNPKNLSQEIAYAIADAVARDGRDVVFAGTKSMAEAVAKWPKTELRFIPSPSRYFRESQYQKNPEEWERNGNGGSTKNQQRVTNNRKAILAGLGLSEQPRQSGAGVQDRDVPRRDSGMAKLLRD